MLFVERRGERVAPPWNGDIERRSTVSGARPPWNGISRGARRGWSPPPWNGNVEWGRRVSVLRHRGTAMLSGLQGDGAPPPWNGNVEWGCRGVVLRHRERQSRERRGLVTSPPNTHYEASGAHRQATPTDSIDRWCSATQFAHQTPMTGRHRHPGADNLSRLRGAIFHRATRLPSLIGLPKNSRSTLLVLSMDAGIRPIRPSRNADGARAPWLRALWQHSARSRRGRWDRDRFVLSCGHASMLLYSCLHRSGYDVSLEDLKEFRQWESRTQGIRIRLHRGSRDDHGPLGKASRMRRDGIADRHWRRCSIAMGMRSWITTRTSSAPTATSWKAFPEAASFAGHFGSAS